MLETFGQYPRKVKFDLFGDRIDQVRLEAGKSYKVSVDAESREFNGRWYTDLRAYAAQEMGAPRCSRLPRSNSALPLLLPPPPQTRLLLQLLPPPILSHQATPTTSHSDSILAIRLNKGGVSNFINFDTPPRLNPEARFCLRIFVNW